MVVEGKYKIMKKLIVDIDNTICVTTNGDYENSKVNKDLVLKLEVYQNNGFEIILFTSRNMRTFNNNVGKINFHTIPIIVDWLKKIKFLVTSFMLVNHGVALMGFILMTKVLDLQNLLKKVMMKLKK